MTRHILPFVVFGTFAGVLLAPFFLRRRKAPEEIGLIPLYEKFSQLQSPANDRGLPGRFALYDTFLVISVYRARVVPYEAVKAVQVKQFLWRRSVSFKYERGTGSSYVEIVSDNPEEILSVLREKCLKDGALRCAPTIPVSWVAMTGFIPLCRSASMKTMA